MLPLARAVTQSVSALDLVAWGVVALVVQIVVFFLVGKLVPRFRRGDQERADRGATLLAALAVAVACSNAASMTTCAGACAQSGPARLAVRARD